MKITKTNDYLNEECTTWTIAITGEIEKVEKMIKMLSTKDLGSELDGGDGERNGKLNTMFGIQECNSMQNTKQEWEKEVRAQYKILKKQI